jgi:hypothetical protein
MHWADGNMVDALNGHWFRIRQLYRAAEVMTDIAEEDYDYCVNNDYTDYTDYPDVNDRLRCKQ